MKTLTKILSLLMAMVMLLSLVACGKKEDSIVGKWEGELSSEALKAMMGELEMDADLDTKIKLYFEFGEDGKGKLSFDEDSMKALAEEFTLKMLDAMTAEMGMSIDDILDAMGMSKEEYIASAIEEMGTEDLDTPFSYTVDGNKLTITDEDDGKTVITFGFDGGNLEMKDAQEEGAEEIIAAMFPMILKPVK